MFEARYCCRCDTLVDAHPGDGMTCGYYDVRVVEFNSWSQFADPGEDFVCDECMFKDPRYVAVYGTR